MNDDGVFGIDKLGIDKFCADQEAAIKYAREAIVRIDKFCADQEAAIKYAREAIVLSLGCRLNEEMEARSLSRDQLAEKAGVSAIDIEALMEGLQWVPAMFSIAAVSRLFAAMDLQVEITTKPLPRKTEPQVVDEVDFRRLWTSLAESGCCDAIDGSEYERAYSAWAKQPKRSWREASDFIRKHANITSETDCD